MSIDDDTIFSIQTEKGQAGSTFTSYGYRYTNTPAIVLKGQWLKEFGFDKGEKIVVHCEDGKLTISKEGAICYGDLSV